MKVSKYIEHARENKGGIPLPWDPIIVSVDTWINRVKRSQELLIEMRQKKLSIEEWNEQVLQVYREDGFVTTIQRIIELDGGSIDDKVSRIVN